MGKRNLATVGRHRDFFADVFDEGTGLDPSIVVRCASPEDAATSYFKNLFENSNAHIRTAVIAVWPADGGREDRTLYDANAVVTPSREPNAEPGEVDVFLDVRLRT